MQIRIANKQDEPSIRQLFELAADELAFTCDFAGTDADLKNVEWSYFGHDGAFFIAEDDKRLIGMAGALKKTETILQLRRLFVVSECRGRGIGQALLKMVIEFASNLDYQAIQCVLNSDSRHLDGYLRHFGFQAADRQDAHDVLELAIAGRRR
ncbi:MAG TPA: GNAT family N-acetyltransferase [Candidatus Obscuribacterales bacterium]